MPSTSEISVACQVVAFLLAIVAAIPPIPHTFSLLALAVAFHAAGSAIR